MINSLEVLISVMSFFMFPTLISSHIKELLNFQRPQTLLAELFESEMILENDQLIEH